MKKSLFLLGILLFCSIHTLKAQQTEDQILNLEQLLSTDLVKADSLHSSIKSFYLRNENDSLYSKFQFYGGVLNYYQENYVIAENYYKKALNTEYAKKELKFKTRIFNNLGVVFELSHRLDSAYYYYQKSIEIERELNNAYGTKETLLNIGLLHIKMKEYAKAKEYLYESLHFFESIRDTNKIALCLQNLGVLYEHTGNLEKADSVASIALNYFKQSNNTYGLSETYYNLISYNTILNQFEKAESLLLNSHNYIDSNGYISKIRIPLIKGLIAIRKGDFEFAETILDNLADTYISDLFINKLIEELRIELYSNNGNIKRHAESFESYKVLSDSLDFINNKNHIAQLEVIHKTEELSQSLENQIILLEKSNREKGVILLFSIICVSLMLLSILFKRRLAKVRSYVVLNARYRKIEHPEENELEDSERQLYNKAVSHLKKTKLYLKSDLKLEHLAFEIGTNISTLSKCINDVSGNNFNFLINRLRVRHAEELLLSGNYSINDISDNAGFGNRTSFYRSFKLITGLSPKEYKEVALK